MRCYSIFVPPFTLNYFFGLLLQVPLKNNTKRWYCGFLKYRLVCFLALSLSITSTLSPQYTDNKTLLSLLKYSSGSVRSPGCCMFQCSSLLKRRRLSLKEWKRICLTGNIGSTVWMPKKQSCTRVTFWERSSQSRFKNRCQQRISWTMKEFWMALGKSNIPRFSTSFLLCSCL